MGFRIHSFRCAGLLAIAVGVLGCKGKINVDSGTACGVDSRCTATEICVFGQCREPCNVTSECEAGHACLTGVCVPVDYECVEASDCVSAAVCETLEGKSCEGGECSYPRLAVGFPCDDGDPCTELDACDQAGLCAGTEVHCEASQEPECQQPDILRTFAATCGTNGCEDLPTDFYCPNCPACMSGCAIDITGDGIAELIDDGAISVTNGCHVCDGDTSRSRWTLWQCQQESPIDVCVSLAGSCDPTVANSTCRGADCCVFEPRWGEGSTDPQPACPFSNEDSNGNGIEDGGEVWSGLCEHGGHCVGCTDGLQCDDGNPCSVDSCAAGVCQYDTTSRLGQVCTVASPSDGHCVLSAGGIAACRLDTGGPCTSDSDCLSGYCIDEFCCNSSCGGNCDRCDLPGALGTCTGDDAICIGNCDACNSSGSCVPDDGLCTGDCDICAGGGNYFRCVDNVNMCEGNCVVCIGSGNEFECVANQDACSGNCASCLPDAEGFTCQGVVNLCSGDCAVCEEEVDEFVCRANQDVCAGECALCDGGHKGSETEYSCIADQTACPASGATLCTTCSLSVDQYLCTYDDTQDGDCALGHECTEVGECLASPGSACNDDDDCADGICGTGFCCDPSGSCATSLGIGWNHSCAVLRDTSARCWGQNTNGKLGDGGTENQVMPVAVTDSTGDLSSVASIAAGVSFTCALMLDQTVQCWGANNVGQLGDDSTDPRGAAAPVPGLTEVASLAAGEDHACAALVDQTVWCWGRNGNGQLGDDSTDGSLVPIEVSGVTTATAVGAGRYHSCAMLSDGVVNCWGRNDLGQLGDASNTQRLTPVAVSGMANGLQMDGGFVHSCWALGDGTAQCAGSGGNGRLGDGGTDNSDTPVDVLHISGVTMVTTGGSFSCAVATGGAYCWGTDYNGQLGNAGGNATAPDAVIGMTTAMNIGIGERHGCAIKQDGTVWCWGYGSSGQLGDGYSNQRPSPVEVIGW